MLISSYWWCNSDKWIELNWFSFNAFEIFIDAVKDEVRADLRYLPTHDTIVSWSHNLLKFNIDIEIITKYLKVRIADKIFPEKKISLVSKERYAWKIGSHKFHKKSNISLIMAMWENLCSIIEYSFRILLNC